MSSLQDRRVWIGGGGIAALLVAAIGWFFVIRPEMSDASSLHNEAASVRLENAALQAKLTTLQKKSARLDQYTSALRSALEALPSDSGLPQFTLQLSAQAKVSGVTLTSVNVGSISSVTSSTTPAEPDGTTSSAAATAPDPAAASTPAAPAAAAATTPATAAGGLYSVQVTIQSSGTLGHQVAFLHAVQVAGPRRALITSTQFAPGAGAKASSIDGASTLTTELTVFSAPQSPDQVAQLDKLLSGHIGN